MPNFDPQQIARDAFLSDVNPFLGVHLYPIDFNNSAAVGINLPLTFPAVFNPNFSTKDAIRNNLINYFMTEPGEIPLNPSFGGGLRSFVFEQITSNNLDFLKERIQTQLQNFFPDITVGNLEITRQEDNNQITISLTYSVVNTNISGEVEFNFV